jgi:DNA-binding response OmpR family regulator
MTITVDLDQQELIAGGKTLVLTRKQSHVAWLLVKAMPRFLNVEVIGDSLWIGDDVKNPRKHVEVVICAIRKKLLRGHMPVILINRYRAGYRLAEVERA